jgi:ATP-dependent phosphoenolpyruvate carboxykinase
VSELYEFALQPEHLASINPHVTPTTIADNGALSVSSGQKTGRTPKDKRVVLDDTTRDVCFKSNM